MTGFGRSEGGSGRFVVEESPCDSQAGGLSACEGQDEACWLAAYTRPRHEDKVSRYCAERGMEVFLPSHRAWRAWSDRKKLLFLPLFPSYVFMRLSASQRLRALQAPGLLWFVRNQAGPVRVSARELDAIRRLLESGLAFDPLPGVQLGDEVEIINGALRGCRGYLMSKDVRSVVLIVAAIQGGVRVNLPDPRWVRPIRPARGPSFSRLRPRPQIMEWSTPGWDAAQ